MASTEARLITLDNSLSPLDQKDIAQWSVATLYNALLDAAKKEHPDDAIIQAIQPAEQTAMGSISVMAIGSMRASIAQLLATYD
jgi:hypothetical protein